MATVARYIYSHYDPPNPEQDKAREPEDDTHTGIDADPWQTESTFSAQTRLARTPQFVPAIVSYDEVNDLIGSRDVAQQRITVEKGKQEEVSRWYRSLPRGSATPSGSPSTSTSTTGAHTPLDVASSSQSAPTPKTVTTKNDWFIRRALLNEPLPASTPVTPPQTLADIFLREPPAMSNEDALRPPVFLTLGPSNRGFNMLERSGWSEGEALGPHASRRNSTAKMNSEKKRVKLENKELPVREEHREVIYGSDDEVSEVRRVEVVDLTLSDSEDEEVDIDGDLVPVPRPSSVAPEPYSHDGTALLTPIPTVLKSDRLGIGLKAKTEGPYRTSKKRVTHNQAALTAHIRATEETKRTKKLMGRGWRALARAAKAESEQRRRLLASLNDPLA